VPQPLDAAVAAASPLHGRVVFVLAPPGSASEVVATGLGALQGARLRPMPRLLFGQGLGRVLANFYVSLWQGAREGLSALAAEQEVLAAARDLADALIVPQDAQLVIDHSPGDIRYAELMAAVYPDATYVQVLRRPEDCLVADRRRPRRLAEAWVAGHQAVLRIPDGVRVVRVDVDVLVADVERALQPVVVALGRGGEVHTVVRAVASALAPPPGRSPGGRGARTVARIAGPLWREIGERQ
jgi:hypothetical protein